MTIHQKYMQALAYMNKTAKADIAAGHQWKYCNVTKKKARNFQQARKQGKYLINCVDGVQWACKIAGIPSNALSWFGYKGGKIVWCSKNAKANAKKYFDIIKIGDKTVQQCLNNGMICQGDILTYVGITHTNAYYKNNKSFDTGHAYCTGSGEGAKFKKWIGSLVCKNSKVGYILRIKDRKHYRVQAGAYETQEELNKQIKLIESKKLNYTLINEDNLTKIQMGYFDGKENAEKLAEKLAKKGITPYIKEL